MVFQYISKWIAKHEYADAQANFERGKAFLSNPQLSSKRFAQAAIDYKNASRHFADADPKHDLAKHAAYLVAGQYLEAVLDAEKDEAFQGLTFSVLLGHPLIPPTMQKREAQSFFGKYARPLFLAGFLPSRAQKSTEFASGSVTAESIVATQMYLLRDTILAFANPYRQTLDCERLPLAFTEEDTHVLDHVLLRYTHEPTRDSAQKIIEGIQQPMREIVAKSKLELELFDQLRPL